MVGAIGNVFGVRQALAAAALILSPTLILYGRAIKRGAEPGLKYAAHRK